MVTARKFKELQVTEKDLNQLEAVEGNTRDVVVPEMLEYRDPRVELSLLDEEQDVTDPRAGLRRLPRRTGTDDS